MQVYQTTHAEIRNLEPESNLYFRLRMDISGRQSVLSDWVNVTMPPPCKLVSIAIVFRKGSPEQQCYWQASESPL